MSSPPSSSASYAPPSQHPCSPPPPESPRIDFDFVKKLHHLEELDPNAYESRFLGSGSFMTGNVYGGLIFAQSIAAAEKTVDMEKFTTHSVQGLFILSGE
jgi:acyl-CoA thioesterase